MIDFTNLVGKEGDKVDYDLHAIYASLDVKSSHTELRTAQKEAIKSLAEREGERDLVLKVSTGSGKTTVGLLYLYGHMLTSKKPVVYLCPTVQLVDQVIGEAKNLGIPAFSYPQGQPIPEAACLRGEAVVVCTYEKLFNAKTTFLRSDVNLIPYALVMDDAHAGVENIRNQFTLKLVGDAFEYLLETIGSRCKAYDHTKWVDIKRADPQATLEVPHWIWTAAVNVLVEGLHKFSGTKEFMFIWPWINQIMSSSRCVISGAYAEITPEVLPVFYVRPYHDAEHRLFMSATLADDSLLTRELGVDPNASMSPIAPNSDRGLGERMILAPSLIEPTLDRQYVMKLCRELSASWNVVVLTSSGQAAAEWEAEGATYYSGASFQNGVDELKDASSEVSYVVFAQRYDGVDLPDDACRILVIDGIPHGESLIDREDSRLAIAPGGIRNRTIFRIEQGMGRAVRSHADFAVVLLVGTDIATFVGRHDVLGSMSADTKHQLKLAIELSGLAKQSSPADPSGTVRQLIIQCLSRDQGWKDYYNQKVRQAKPETTDIDVSRIKLAHEESECHRLVAMNAAQEARTRFNQAIEAADLGNAEKGIYLQRLARIVGITSPEDALTIQLAARNLNMSVSNPPATSRKLPAPGSKAVSELFIKWFNEFAVPNAAVVEAQRIADQLDLDAKPAQVEETLRQLGIALGADSHRPDKEYGEGPDNLWFWGGECFVIEAKSQNKDSLHKKDANQLLGSIAWVKKNYPQYGERLNPLIVASVRQADKGAEFPVDVRVLGEEGCAALGLALTQVCQKMAQEGPLFVTPENVAKQMNNFRLLPTQLFSSYTDKVQKSK